MPVHAVTGASSHVGHYAVHQLLARGVLLGALRHLTAAAAAGRRAGCNLRPCGSRLVSAGSHLIGEA
jgi:NAD(P)-dependent dehydrogenase (short-subunit alcohol dehydrogenase family)